MQIHASGASPRQKDEPQAAVTTIRGAARFLVLSPRAIQNYIRSGKLKAVRIGGAVRIPLKQLEELVR